MADQNIVKLVDRMLNDEEYVRRLQAMDKKELHSWARETGLENNMDQLLPAIFELAEEEHRQKELSDEQLQQVSAGGVLSFVAITMAGKVGYDFVDGMVEEGTGDTIMGHAKTGAKATERAVREGTTSIWRKMPWN